MQKNCSHCTSIWEYITCWEMTVKNGKFCFCSNVDNVTDNVTTDGRLFQVFTAATQNARSQTAVDQSIARHMHTPVHFCVGLKVSS